MARWLGAGLVTTLLLWSSVGASDQDDADLPETRGRFQAAAPDAGGDDLDDGLGGFYEADGLGSGARGEEEAERFWDLTGSTSVALSYNYRSHRAARKNTDYQGVQRLRTRLNLQLDIDLPYEWKARMAGFVFYDFAYLIHGRNDYTQDVIDRYEWDIDTQDAWLQGSVTENLDLKIGRQVVNWGRSDTIRVLDVINPLDSSDPGLADIEDLRRPIGMARADYYWDRFSFTALAIPEIRFNLDPPPGSDFNPAPPPPPGIADPHEHTPEDFAHWEWAAAVTGIFQGWDVSLHFAYVYDHTGHLESVLSLPLRVDHNRLTLVGAGGNYTIGNWLLKSEIAWADGYGFTDASDKSRLDVMAGVEYYGINDTSIALEIAERHYFDFPGQPTLETGFFVPQEDSVETALRVTSSFLNDRLELSALGLLFSGEDFHDGSIVRLQASYDIRDALVATAGILLFQEGDILPLNAWGKNDRLFFEVKYSF